MKRSEVVVITGASAGVGRATARLLAREGASIGLIARGEEALEATRREVEELGGRALVLPLDVADAKALDDAARKVEQTFGPIDIWFNNAMVSVFSPVIQMKPEEYRRVTEVTYLGLVYGTLAALRGMLPRDKGTIVQVGSALAYRSIPLQSAYCAAKHAARGFTDSLRSELAHRGSKVHVTMVQLPGLNTPQFDWVKSRMPGRPRALGKVYQPELAAEALVFAAHHKRREMFVGWPVYKAIFGNKVMPGPLDQYLGKIGIDGQQDPGPVSPNRQDNLWNPVPGEHGAHGRFDDEAHKVSPMLWATEHRTTAAVTALAGGAALGALLWWAASHIDGSTPRRAMRQVRQRASQAMGAVTGA